MIRLASFISWNDSITSHKTLLLCPWW